MKTWELNFSKNSVTTLDRVISKFFRGLTSLLLTLVLGQKISSSFAEKSILIGIFNEFIDEPVKDYVFHRISRKLLLEITIRILQEFIERGVERARSLKLVIVKVRLGEHTILTAPNDSNGEIHKDPYSAPEVIDTTFRLSDKSDWSFAGCSIFN